MISQTFVLCCALLVTGSLAYPKVASEPKEYVDAAMQAGVAFLADVVSGKNFQQALVDRGLEASASLSDELSSAAKSALKRIKELQDGGSVEDALRKTGQAILNKGANKFTKLREFLDLFKDDSIEKILEAGAKALAKVLKKSKK